MTRSSLTEAVLPPPAAQPRAAATLIVLRDSPAGMQVLLLQRAEKPGDQNSGAVVFPGGLLDPADRGLDAVCGGVDAVAASARMALPSGGLAYWIAAVRECFEEAGLLYACDDGGQLVDLDRFPSDEVWALRRALHANEIDMAQVCDRLGVRLALGELAYYSHWITPLGLPKIFDTRFFVARAPAQQTALHDSHEMVDLLWITPSEALARGLKLMNVTERTLRQLARFSSADEAVAAARAQAAVPQTRPRLATGPQGRRVHLHPGDYAYAEIGRLDPQGHGRASAELVPGRPVWLSARVLRVTAPNANMMSGPGTNSYFIGAPGSDEWTLLDPGPDDASHVQALTEAAPGRVTRIIVTHTHTDHSPAAHAMKEATGAATYGRVALHREGQDLRFEPDHVLRDGDRLAIGQGVTLRAIHTPGHASNQFCYLLEEEKLLFTGDHLMQGTTVVIYSPDGDMAAYLRSLRRLLDEDLEWVAPGHGFLIDAPHEEVRKTIAHRLAREAQVVADLRNHGPAEEAAILARVYAGIDPRLHGAALRSLRAHLLKLQEDGTAVQQCDGRWRLS